MSTLDPLTASSASGKAHGTLHGEEASSEAWDVIVVGAGMAGLTCARALGEGGLRVLILEARDRVGGRVASVSVPDGEPVELGAEFVHGQPPELMALIAEAGTEVYERDGARVCFQNGHLQECGGEMDSAFDLLDGLEAYDGEDLSFADYLDRAGAAANTRDAVIGYVEGFNAADAHLASALALGVQQVAEDAIGGDLVFKVRGGYSLLPEFLSRRVRELRGELRTEVPVRRIRWRRGHAEVQAGAGTFTAPKLVLTLPLGVLLSGTVPIDPEPTGIMRAARQMRSGDVCRFTASFRERFWRALPPTSVLRDLSFLFTSAELPRVWWTPHPDPSSHLTGWIGGPRATRLLGMSGDDLGRLASKVLGRVFGVGEEFIKEQTVACYTHNWTADEFACGSYSYVGVGGKDASRAMSQPQDETLFFAGEHTDTTGHWGTVHGAMRSGLRAAEQVLADRHGTPS